MIWTSGWTDTSYLKLNPVFIQIMSTIGFKDFTMQKLGILGHQEEHQNATTSTDQLKGPWTTNTSVPLHCNWQSEVPNCITERRCSSCAPECFACLAKLMELLKEVWLNYKFVVPGNFSEIWHSAFVNSSSPTTAAWNEDCNLVKSAIHASWPIPGKLDGIHESNARVNFDNWRLFGGN